MRTTWRNVIQGVVFLVIVSMLTGLTILKFQRKIFSPDEIPATLVVGTAGTQLGSDADVKVRGIVVGRVAEQSSDGQNATLSLRILKDKVQFVPRNVKARILPKTLFGEKFVDLVIPPGGAATQRLQPGDEIPRDTSAEAIEVERVLADLFPLLRAVQPEQLNAALTAIADGLRGRGDQIGEGLENLDRYLAQINTRLPTIQQDLSGLADLAESLEDNADEIVRIARNSIVSGETLTSQERTLSDFLRGTAGFSDTLTDVMRRNGDALIYLSGATRQTLETIYPKRDVLPGSITGLNTLLTELNAALNHGPALSIRLEPVDTRGSYDTPCDYPDRNYRGGCSIGEGTVHEPAEPPPFPGLAVAGRPGSAEEREAVRELIAADLDVTPEEVPDLAVMLIAPILRGTAVELR